ncbi:2023_t:CDS:2, partial [Entrophospora sp. SA101]
MQGKFHIMIESMESMKRKMEDLEFQVKRVRISSEASTIPTQEIDNETDIVRSIMSNPHNVMYFPFAVNIQESINYISISNHAHKGRFHDPPTSSAERDYQEYFRQQCIPLTVEKVNEEIIYHCTACAVLKYDNSGWQWLITLLQWTPEELGWRETEISYNKNSDCIKLLKWLGHGRTAQVFEGIVLKGQHADHRIALYNEELKDLLSDNDRDKLIVSMKGLKNHKEMDINNASEGIDISKQGVIRRKTAETNYNKKSSRSHSIFTVTVEMSLNDEKLTKVEKLNFVDLAGSECVALTGTNDTRSKETGNINTSLLTLGRCINLLGENSGHGHVPYTKLTQLLKDSFGGNTKTTMIATISPVEANLSTLNYASQAKNIINKPVINRKEGPCNLQNEIFKEENTKIKDLHDLNQNLNLDEKDGSVRKAMAELQKSVNDDPEDDIEE